MEEQLLHFIWHRRLYADEALTTTTGQQVRVIHPGIPNHDQGPDFLQARIHIDEHLWAGHVEIHVRSSSWYLHTHEKDTHYNNVILHVVWVEDQPVKTEAGVVVPCLELHDKVDLVLFDRYRHLMNNREWVPCASALQHVSEIIRTSWLERLMAERLEQKTDYIATIFSRCGNDWEQTFFVLLSRHLGAPANSDPMENLGLKIPLSILRKYGDRIDQIEAILFGVAGMLTKEIYTDYPLRLKKEFDFLKIKHGLQVIPSLQWKFMRMRPTHFPTVRIAQLAVILSKQQAFIQLLTHMHTAEEWIQLFRVAPHHDFWKTHYHFKSESTVSGKKLGIDTAVSMMINLVAPFMFYYGKQNGLSALTERAIKLIAELPAEKNTIIRSWSSCGWHAEDAGQSQALIHLKKHYCDQRRCLHCAVGLDLLK
ncbi:MAG: DUF2851 family protein [Bacteroidota bacterium]|nr:DUF2851 family protein [Bacteroidota bacterium]